MIHEVSEDILLSRADVVAHGVAPNDHLDSGLALALRERWLSLVKDFRHGAHLCRAEAGRPLRLVRHRRAALFCPSRKATAPRKMSWPALGRNAARSAPPTSTSRVAPVRPPSADVDEARSGWDATTSSLAPSRNQGSPFAPRSSTRTFEAVTDAGRKREVKSRSSPAASRVGRCWRFRAGHRRPAAGERTPDDASGSQPHDDLLPGCVSGSGITGVKPDASEPPAHALGMVGFTCRGRVARRPFSSENETGDGRCPNRPSGSDSMDVRGAVAGRSLPTSSA
ncbi:MAG: hypothetical protein RL199_970 [Pseudomonadota bacterium]|jgi:hypothetical protein